MTASGALAERDDSADNDSAHDSDGGTRGTRGTGGTDGTGGRGAPGGPGGPGGAGPFLRTVGGGGWRDLDRERADRRLGERIVALSGRLSAGTCRWLLMVAEFDARGGFAAFGLHTTAAWLSYACGLSRRTALDHVRVARCLAAFPEVAEQMSRGRLSYSQVRAISRALNQPAPDTAEPPAAEPPAAAVPAPPTAAVPAAEVPAPPAPSPAPQPGNEQQLAAELINVAQRGTVAQLESVVRGLRTVASNENQAAGGQPEDRVGIGWNADQTWRLSARLRPERGAVIEAALDRLRESDGLSRADALVRLAEIAIAALNDASADGAGPRALRGDERAAIVVHIDADRIPREFADTAATHAPGSVPARSAERAGRPSARLAEGPGLPDSVTLRLACDGRIRTAVTSRDAEERLRILDVGRSHRLATARQRRALMLRQSGRCAHPGCANRRALEAHHVVHWLHGGRTDLDNLVLLCPAHHHGHHDGGFTISATGAGAFAFALPDGTQLPDAVDPSPLIAGEAPIEHEFPDVADDAATTAWDGERLDRAWAVSCLAAVRYRAA